MGALTKKRNRSIDSLWRGNDSLIAAVEAAVGLQIGSDDGVLFIQDVGTKVVGRAYIDKNNGKMYRCVVGTTSVSNDSNFEMIGISDNSDDINAIHTPINVYGNVKFLDPDISAYAAFIVSSILFISLRIQNPSNKMGVDILELDLSGVNYKVFSQQVRSNINWGDSNFDFIKSSPSKVTVTYWNNNTLNKPSVTYATIVFPLQKVNI